MKKSIKILVVAILVLTLAFSLASCNQAVDKLIYYEGLEFALNDDGNSYSMTGIGTCVDTDIIIPDTCNDLPVTSIGDYVFYECNSLTIYCEAESKPNGWDDDWNEFNCPVVWGYKGE